MNNDTLNGFEELAEGMAPMPPALELDPQEYMGYLGDCDLTEAQKIEFLQTLWSIMAAFVELGFTTNICEQIFESGLPGESDADEGVNSAPHKERYDDR